MHSDPRLAPPGREGAALSRDDGAVAVEGLGVRLGGREILREVSAVFRPGELTAVLGPNGAGKTTLVRALLGLAPATSGVVRLGGKDLAAYRSKELARTIALVPQDTHFEFSFTVGEFVLMGRYPHLGALERERPLDREAARRVLEEIGLSQLAGRRMTALSAGERQRAFIARALATEAPVLAADEPFAHLDVSHRLAALELLRRLVAKGRTVILVLHDINQALRFADRILVVAAGRVIHDGTPASLAGEGAAVIEEAFGVEVERHGRLLEFRLPGEPEASRRRRP